jgi:hypothetical protein
MKRGQDLQRDVEATAGVLEWVVPEGRPGAGDTALVLGRLNSAHWPIIQMLCFRVLFESRRPCLLDIRCARRWSKRRPTQR